MTSERRMFRRYPVLACPGIPHRLVPDNRVRVVIEASVLHAERIENVLLCKGTSLQSADACDDLCQEEIAGVAVREPVPRVEVELPLPGEEIDELTRRIAEAAPLGFSDQVDKGQVFTDSTGVSNRSSIVIRSP